MLLLTVGSGDSNRKNKDGDGSKDVECADEVGDGDADESVCEHGMLRSWPENSVAITSH